MTITESAQGGRARHEHDHAKLRDWLADLRSAPPEEHPELLRGLREFLVSHFAHEESEDGLFGFLRREARTHAVEGLQEDHRHIMSQLDDLSAHPDATALQQWIATMAAHEERETELVQEVLITDVGVGD